MTSSSRNDASRSMLSRCRRIPSYVVGLDYDGPQPLMNHEVHGSTEPDYSVS